MRSHGLDRVTSGILLIALMSAVWLLIACGGDDSLNKAPLQDDFSPLKSLTKGDSQFSNTLKLLGTLSYEEKSVIAMYQNPPLYWGYSFDSFGADQVDIWVKTMHGGDAVAWLLDEKFEIVAQSDDAGDGSSNSHIALQLPSNQPATYYIVFRDYYSQPAKFEITLKGTADTHGKDDPFNETSCTGNPLTMTEAANFFASGATSYSIGTFITKFRVRECNNITGCTNWTPIEKVKLYHFPYASSSYDGYGEADPTGNLSLNISNGDVLLYAKSNANAKGAYWRFSFSYKNNSANINSWGFENFSDGSANRNDAFNIQRFDKNWLFTKSCFRFLGTAKNNDASSTSWREMEFAMLGKY